MSDEFLSTSEFDVVTVDAQGRIKEKVQKTAPSWLELLKDGIELELVAIPGGTFVMGAPKLEEGWHPNQSPQHVVTVPSFWMSRTPITQVQWSAIATLPPVQRRLSPNPSCFSGANRPVEQVSWQDAIEFCARLSAFTQRLYRLPSEAEWEYACRARPMPAATLATEDIWSLAEVSAPFHFGPTITTDLANYSGVNWEFDGRLCSKGFYGQGPTGCDRRETTDVASFGIANAFGLCDMHGLVKEWCADHWHDHYDGAPSDGSAWTTGGNPTVRVLRGGSWNGGPRVCRSAFRSKADQDSNLYDIGIRVVRES
ncbi:MAG: formylglycine-generating enzyme family protein [Leptolyngbyaceae cyanobacterium bins.349]|nr:formylglycine-generating enzyme family protein [Leptolyngbyaceae cyanobacterium bins.349]